MTDTGCHPAVSLSPGRLLLALLLGTGLTVALLLGYYLGLERYGRADVLRFDPDQLQLVLGEGETKSTGIRVSGLDDARGFAQISGSMGPLIQTARIDELHWHIEGWQAGTEIDLLWIDQFRQPHLAPLRHSGRSTGQLSLESLSEWQGSILGIGLLIHELSGGPLIVRELVLRPALPDVSGLLDRLWTQWTRFEGWRGYSEHLIVGGAGELIGPTPVVAIWVALSALSYVPLANWRRIQWNMAPLLALLLAGWLVLDLRWQSDLLRQFKRSIAELAGKSRQEQLAVYDDTMAAFIEQVRQALPEDSVRLFLIGDDRESFEYARAHYNLLPHNVYGFRALPPPRVALTRAARAGDYVLLLLPLEGIRYHRAPGQEALLWNSHELPVELLLAQRQGLLFRIREVR